MKYNYSLFELISRYCRWANFDWCALVHDPLKDLMFAYDFDKNKSITINKVIRRILDNKNLDECFDLYEISTFMVLVPRKFRKEILTFL